MQRHQRVRARASARGRLWIGCGVLVLVGATHAAEPKIWAPYGYLNLDDFNRKSYWSPDAPPVARSLSRTPQAVCATYQEQYKEQRRSYCAPVAVPNRQFTALGWCTEYDYTPWACTTDDYFANMEENSTVAVAPACYPLPLKDRRPTNAVGSMAADSTGLQCQCKDRDGRVLPDAIPDPKSGYCVVAHDFSVSASPLRFSIREAGKPVSIEVMVRRSDDTPAVDEPVTLAVESGAGAPGTLGLSAGTTDASGRLKTDYRFPRFTTAQTDKVVATCRNCKPETASVEIGMAPVVIGFFNGVGNTEEDAKGGLEALVRLMGSSYRDSPIRYENFYNQTGRSTSSTLLQDLAETFIQRSAELDGVLGNRWEHYWDLVASRHGDPASLTGSLIGGLGSGGLALARLLDATFNATLGQIVAGWARMLADPPTGTDMATHLATLRALADEGSDIVMVAHSQGNLFVNAAYDGLRGSHPGTKASVVHVAPASPTLRGGYGLSGLDLVINGLRAQGVNSVQPANWNIPFGQADASGHAWVATYLDAAREGRAKVKALIDSALQSL
jgi:hypothetical protein